MNRKNFIKTGIKAALATGIYPLLPYATVFSLDSLIAQVFDLPNLGPWSALAFMRNWWNRLACPCLRSYIVIS